MERFVITKAEVTKLSEGYPIKYLNKHIVKPNQGIMKVCKMILKHNKLLDSYVAILEQTMYDCNCWNLYLVERRSYEKKNRKRKKTA